MCVPLVPGHERTANQGFLLRCGVPLKTILGTVDGVRHRSDLAHREVAAVGPNEAKRDIGFVARQPQGISPGDDLQPYTRVPFRENG